MRSISFRTRRFAADVRQELFAARLAWRRRARLRDQVNDGVTVVAVTWNSLQCLKVLLEAIDVYSHGTLKIVVVDNASTDGTSEFLRARPEVEVVELSRNYGHGLALDAGVHAARTRYIVTLDVDAFPISKDWVEAVIKPLQNGFTLAGAHFAGYIHPCYMAIERHRFLEDKHTFAASYSRRLRIRRKGMPRGWDAGKLISLRDSGPHYEIAPSSVRGPGDLGTVFGELVYHHFYSTRLSGTLTPDVVRSGVTVEISRVAWSDAVERYGVSAEP